MSSLLSTLRLLVKSSGSHGQFSDGELLRRFLAERDEAAFTTLWTRHGPMVFGVCSRTLNNNADVEDAVQATFMVLVRKARSIAPPDLVGPWLHGVAYRTALKLRAMNQKRILKEKMVCPAKPRDPDRGELGEILDREIERLPHRYRMPLVLCDLEQHSRRETAQQLGLPEGTVASRLARARQILARRLTRRGLAISAAALVPALTPSAASAQLSKPLFESTFKAVLNLTATPTAAGGFVSPQVAALTERMIHAMMMEKVRKIVLVIILIGGLGLAAADLARRAWAKNPAEPVSFQAQTEKKKPDSPAPFPLVLKGTPIVLAGAEIGTSMKTVERSI